MGSTRTGIDQGEMGWRKAEATNKIRHIWVGIRQGSMGLLIKATSSQEFQFVLLPCNPHATWQKQELRWCPQLGHTNFKQGWHVGFRVLFHSMVLLSVTLLYNRMKLLHLDKVLQVEKQTVQLFFNVFAYSFHISNYNMLSSFSVVVYYFLSSSMIPHHLIVPPCGVFLPRDPPEVSCPSVECLDQFPNSLPVSFLFSFIHLSHHVAQHRFPGNLEFLAISRLTAKRGISVAVL